MCAPEWFHLRHGEHAYPKDVYANDGEHIVALTVFRMTPLLTMLCVDEYFADIAVAYQEEIKELYSLGCRTYIFRTRTLSTTYRSLLCNTPGNIQFDDPLLAYFCAESMITGMDEVGIDHEKLLSTYIKAYQACLHGRPADMNVGLHLCRGNFRVRCSLSGD